MTYLVELGDGGQVEEDAAIFHLNREGEQLHVLVLHVVEALAAENSEWRKQGKKSDRQTDR